ncbi:MAG: helix-turn-helix domain-containing protein [Clostridia bacterium]
MHIEILLKQVRKGKKITLKKLSDKSGVSTTHINDVENNLKSPSLLVMIQLAKALDVEITELYKVKW